MKKFFLVLSFLILTSCQTSPKAATENRRPQSQGRCAAELETSFDDSMYPPLETNPQRFLGILDRAKANADPGLSAQDERELRRLVQVRGNFPALVSYRDDSTYIAVIRARDCRALLGRHLNFQPEACDFNCH